MRVLIFSLMLCGLIAQQAEARITALPPGCTMKENITLSVSFNGVEQNVRAVAKHIDANEVKILAYAKKLGIENIRIQSRNYNISMQNQGNGFSQSYNYNGSIGFRLPSSEKATDLIELLAEEHIQSSLNVNSYQQGSCQ